MTSLLRIDSSARHDGSASRELSSRLIDRIRKSDADLQVTTRDLTTGVPIITEEILHAMWSAPDERTTEQRAALALADELIAELVAAEAVVIGLPIYNFGPPAALKAWADLVARAGTTFRYTETGPEGLIADKPVYVILASGGVPVASPMDFSSTWLTTFLGFLGLSNVTVIAADQLNADPDNALDAARARVDNVALAAV
jgi:FMN-dependent NADH-azoreductase